MLRRFDRTTALADLAAIVRDFTEPYNHDETLTPMAQRIHGKRYHRSTHDPLWTQLLDAATPGSVAESVETLHTRSESHAPIAQQALDVAYAIERAVVDWLWCTHTRPEARIPDSMRRLVSAASNELDDRDLATLLAEAKAWWKNARVAVGWERPSLDIAEPCPACTRRNALRIAGDGTAAWCTRCGNRWSENDPAAQSVTLLADALAISRTTLESA